ncbi:MAG: hypothetical protein AAGC85_25045, partial [Bacteroidota bacterium]
VVRAKTLPLLPRFPLQGNNPAILLSSKGVTFYAQGPPDIGFQYQVIVFLRKAAFAKWAEDVPPLLY